MHSDHVLFDFEHDEEGLVKSFPLVFTFLNALSDHGLYCGINPESGEMVRHSRHARACLSRSLPALLVSPLQDAYSFN